MQAERMAGVPNVELVAVDFAQHNVIEPLIRQQRFMPLLKKLVGAPAVQFDDNARERPGP